VDRIRVLVITPPLQADVLRAAFTAEQAIELVGESTAGRAVDAVAATGAQVAVLGGEDVRRSTALKLLAAHPWLKVFRVVGSGHETVLYECRPVTTVLGEVSPSMLVRAILRSVGPTRPEAAR
jgi:hypothetical protein